jgi:hypothetical protein
MKSTSFIVFLWLVACFSVFGQTADYQKFSLSVHVGKDFPLGKSNTPGQEPGYVFPVSSGFGATFDGAYFFTKNYGIGVKYHLFSTKVRDQFEWIIPDDKYVEFTFNETTHFIGPAFFGKWTLGNTKWEIPVSIGIGFVSNKLSKHMEFIRYITYIDPNNPVIIEPDPDRMDAKYHLNDMSSHSAGIAWSAGVCYRIFPALGISVHADGLFSNTKKQKTTDWLDEPITIDLPRKMNRIGISTGLSYHF